MNWAPWRSRAKPRTAQRREALALASANVNLKCIALRLSCVVFSLLYLYLAPFHPIAGD